MIDANKEKRQRDGQRFTCFTAEEQKLFDDLPDGLKKYVIFRGQGYNKKRAYIQAGYAAGQASNAAQMAERRKPYLKDLISKLQSHTDRVAFYREGTEQAKKIDEKINGEIAKLEGSMVPFFDRYVEESLPYEKLEDVSTDEARNIQFLRRIVNGTIKAKKVTKTYDKDGYLKGIKVEETDDPELRMKAQKELNRFLGLKDVLEIGTVKAGSITFTIVDATKKNMGENDAIEDPIEKLRKQALDVEEYEVVEDGEKDGEES